MPEPIYRLAEGVQWAVENDGLVVIQREPGRAHRFGYPQAAVWDLLLRGYRHERLVRMLAAIASVDEPRAAQLLRESLTGWYAQGLLTVEPRG